MKSRLKNAWSWLQPRLWPGTLVAIGLGLTIYIGFNSGPEKEQSVSTGALLALLAGIFQLLGAAKFHAIGKVDPSHARSAVRNLAQMQRRSQYARQVAEQTFSESKNGPARHSAGIMSVELSWIEEGLLNSIDDWKEFHSFALEDVVPEIPQNSSENEG